MLKHFDQGLDFSKLDQRRPWNIVNEVLHMTYLSYLYQSLEELVYEK